MSTLPLNRKGSHAPEIIAAYLESNDPLIKTAMPHKSSATFWVNIDQRHEDSNPKTQPQIPVSTGGGHRVGVVTLGPPFPKEKHPMYIELQRCAYPRFGDLSLTLFFRLERDSEIRLLIIASLHCTWGKGAKI